MASPLPENLEGLEARPAPVLSRRVPAGSAWRRWGRHLVLLLLTAASVFLAGAQGENGLDVGAGLQMAAALLAILGSHEMGHYLACRFYRVDATLPFFIPALWLPLGGLASWLSIPFFGTFGAVIRIRDRFPDRKALFDIGIAGPLAGFIVCLPVLFLALRQVQLVPESGLLGIPVADPLAFRLAAPFFLPPVPPGMVVAWGPLGTAAWCGLLVTALNLMPVGQLDGGHVIYALFRGRARFVSRAAWFGCLALILVSPSWILWAVLLYFLGRDHPATVDDERPLGWARVLVSLLGLLVLVLSFMPDPFPGAWQELGDLPGALRDVLAGLFRR